MKHINLFKSMLALALAFGVVQIANSQQVFLGNTPTVNPLFMARLKNSPSYVASLPGTLFSRLTGNQAEKAFASLPKVEPEQVPKGLLFNSIAKGALAAEDSQTGKKYLKLQKGTKVRITVQTLPDGTQQKTLEILPE